MMKKPLALLVVLMLLMPVAAFGQEARFRYIMQEVLKNAAIKEEKIKQINDTLKEALTEKEFSEAEIGEVAIFDLNDFEHKALYENADGVISVWTFDIYRKNTPPFKELCLVSLGEREDGTFIMLLNPSEIAKKGKDVNLFSNLEMRIIPSLEEW